jgi:DNA-binding NarL/FixJ family response regulator
MPAALVKLLVVDDHAVVRRGLVEILKDQPRATAVSEAGTAAEAIAAVKRGRFDAVVLDLTLPDRNGIEVLGEIVQLRPGMPVLMLSMHPEDQFAARAMKAGAAGYITKESAPAELTRAVRHVMAGRPYLGAALSRRLGARSGPPHTRLSAREFAVFLRLAEGRRLKEIGAELGLSIKTISTYRTRVLQKLGCDSNARLTLYAIDQGLLARTP